MRRRECERYEAMISALLDDELDETEREELKQHVSECDSCGALCVAMAAASGALRMAQENVPGSLHAGIMAKVNEEARARRARKRWRVLRPALAAAACLVVIAGAVFAMRTGFRAGLTGSEPKNTSASGASVAFNSGTGASMAAAGGAAPAAAPESGMAEEASDGVAAEKAETPRDMFGMMADMREAENGDASPSEQETVTGEAEPPPAPFLEENAVSHEADRGRETPSLELEILEPLPGESGFTARVLFSGESGVFHGDETVTVRPAEGAALPELSAGNRARVFFRGVEYTAADGWTVYAEEAEQIGGE